MTTNTLPTAQDDRSLIESVNETLYLIASLQHRAHSLQKRFEDSVEIAKRLLEKELAGLNYRLKLLHPKVIPWAKLEITATPSKTKTAKLPGVKMSFRAAADKVEVDDNRVKAILSDSEKREALAELGLVKTTHTLNKTALKDFMKAQGGVPEELAGMVTVTTDREDTFSIKFEDMDKFLDSLMNLALGEDPTEQALLDHIESRGGPDSDWEI